MENFRWILPDGRKITLSRSDVASDRATEYANAMYPNGMAPGDPETNLWNLYFHQCYCYAIDDIHELADWVKQNPSPWVGPKSKDVDEILAKGKLELC
jgi:hypothetical protein